jgi:hypothetical protein
MYPATATNILGASNYTATSLPVSEIPISTSGVATCPINPAEDNQVWLNNQSYCII